MGLARNHERPGGKYGFIPPLFVCPPTKIPQTRDVFYAAIEAKPQSKKSKWASHPLVQSELLLRHVRQKGYSTPNVESCPTAYKGVHFVEC